MKNYEFQLKFLWKFSKINFQLILILIILVAHIPNYFNIPCILSLFWNIINRFFLFSILILPADTELDPLDSEVAFWKLVNVCLPFCNASDEEDNTWVKSPFAVTNPFTEASAIKKIH